MDMYIPSVYNPCAKDIALDVTVGHPDVHQCPPHGASSPGAAASLAEHAKVSLFGDYCDASDILLVPVGIDTYGALGKSGSITRFLFCLPGMKARQVSTRRMLE